MGRGLEQRPPLRSPIPRRADLIAVGGGRPWRERRLLKPTISAPQPRSVSIVFLEPLHDDPLDDQIREYGRSDYFGALREGFPVLPTPAQLADFAKARERRQRQIFQAQRIGKQAVAAVRDIPAMFGALGETIRQKRSHLPQTVREARIKEQAITAIVAESFGHYFEKKKATALSTIRERRAARRGATVYEDPRERISHTAKSLESTLANAAEKAVRAIGNTARQKAFDIQVYLSEHPDVLGDVDARLTRGALGFLENAGHELALIAESARRHPVKTAAVSGSLILTGGATIACNFLPALVEPAPASAGGIPVATVATNPLPAACTDGQNHLVDTSALQIEDLNAKASYFNERMTHQDAVAFYSRGDAIVVAFGDTQAEYDVKLATGQKATLDKIPGMVFTPTRDGKGTCIYIIDQKTGRATFWRIEGIEAYRDVLSRFQSSRPEGNTPPSPGTPTPVDKETPTGSPPPPTPTRTNTPPPPPPKDTLTPTVTRTNTPRPPTVTPTEAPRPPEYAITRYFINTGFDDGLSQFSHYSQLHPNDCPTSYTEIVDDPTGSGRGKVFRSVASGPPSYTKGDRHRIYIGPDGFDHKNEFEDYNPGPWGSEFDFRIQSGHKTLVNDRSSTNYLIFFDPADIGRDPYNGDTFHPAFQFKLVNIGGSDYINLQIVVDKTHSIYELTTSKTSIQDDRWYHFKVITTLDKHLFVWIDEVLDEGLSVELPSSTRIGLATGTNWGLYAGTYTADQNNPLVIYHDNIQLYQIQDQ